jgi:hypothetical protein
LTNLLRHLSYCDQGFAYWEAAVAPARYFRTELHSDKFGLPDQWFENPTAELEAVGPWRPWLVVMVANDTLKADTKYVLY